MSTNTIPSLLFLPSCFPPFTRQPGTVMSPIKATGGQVQLLTRVQTRDMGRRVICSACCFIRVLCGGNPCEHRQNMQLHTGRPGRWAWAHRSTQQCLKANEVRDKTYSPTSKSLTVVRGHSALVKLYKNVQLGLDWHNRKCMDTKLETKHFLSHSYVKEFWQVKNKQSTEYLR